MKSISVRRSRSILAAAAALFAAMAAVLFLTRGPIRYIGVWVFLLTGLGFLLFRRFCTVQYSEENRSNFTVRTLFGARRTVAYNDLWGIRNNRLYLPKGSILLAKGTSTDRFLEYANRRYQSAHGKRIPKVFTLRRSYDPMNGNVYEPWSYISIVGGMFLVNAALFVFFLLNNENSLPAVTFGICASFCGFMLMMLIYVGRNADILPRWLVALFYRQNTLKFQMDQYQGKNYQ